VLENGVVRPPWPQPVVAASVAAAAAAAIALSAATTVVLPVATLDPVSTTRSVPQTALILTPGDARPLSPLPRPLPALDGRSPESVSTEIPLGAAELSAAVPPQVRTKKVQLREWWREELIVAWRDGI